MKRTAGGGVKESRSSRVCARASTRHARTPRIRSRISAFSRDVPTELYGTKLIFDGSGIFSQTCHELRVSLKMPWLEQRMLSNPISQS